MNRIVMEALTWLNVPFRHQGRDRSGVDCAGLVIAVGRACNALGDVPAGAQVYTRAPRPDAIQALLDACGVRVDAPRPGDVLWFGHRRATTHLGIWTGDKVIHADGIIGRVVLHKLYEPLRAVYRYPLGDANG